MATLLAVQLAITSHLDREEVLQMIADGARQLTGSQGTAVYLLEGAMLRLAYLSIAPGTGSRPDLQIGYAIPLEHSLGRVAFETGRPLLIEDVPSDPHLNPDLRRRINIRSYLGVPLFRAGHPIGLLVAVDKQTGPLTCDDERVLTLLAASAVSGLENARRYAQAEEEAAAAERGRIARELHDAVTQTLFSAHMTAEVLPQIWEADPVEGRRRLEFLRQSTRGALAEMRSLLLELRPTALLQTELADLIRGLANAFTGRTQVPVQVAVDCGDVMPAEVKVGLYRIVQESLTNIAKHSEASQVEVRVAPDTGGLQLLIHDDGQGFDPAAVTGEHLGLRIMQERAAALKASWSLETETGRGTTIRVVWPARNGAPCVHQ